MLKLHLKRALQDIRSNRMLSLVTISTFALSILIVSSAMLFFINLGDIIESHQHAAVFSISVLDG